MVEDDDRTTDEGGGKGGSTGGSGRRGAGGPWQDRVRFSGAMAYRPHDVLVRTGLADAAREALAGAAEGDLPEPEPVGASFVRLTVPDPLEAVATLRAAGIVAQVDHVLFATGCCPPHPAGGSAPVARGSAPDPEEVKASPYFANPYFANPYFANAGAGGCCGCGCPGGSLGANPYFANPYFANPYFANPYFANAATGPGLRPATQASGRRRSSARPARAVPSAPAVGAEEARAVHVAVLDTGWAGPAFAPTGLPNLGTGGNLVGDDPGSDHPDEDGDGYLDPAAGHGTFIAGVIELDAPGCTIELLPTLGSYGDGAESDVVRDLEELADPDRVNGVPDLVNLSFGGYSTMGMEALAHAVSQLTDRGSVVVASAGNDATCVPMYPAALPGVVGVGALDDEGRPAVFTNYGPWVRACAPGVDVVSVFFAGFDGAEPAVGGVDPDRFEGWAEWSGTSFAAPRVVAALARLIREGETPEGAVARLIDDPALPYQPMLGTPVPRP